MPERVAENSEPVRNVPEAPVISPQMESAGVSSSPTQFTSQTVSESGQNVLQPTPTDVIIPASSEALASAAKGSVGWARTWWGAFWERIIRIAIGQGRRTRVADANAS